MLELFLISECADEDLLKAQQLLQGFCEMAPVHTINRRLLWKAPHVPKQKGFDQGFLARQQPPRGYLWRSLQDALVRQAYHINVIYGVSRDQFGDSDALMEGTEDAGKKPSLDETPGTLYWADWPDPKSTRTVNSRTAISIENERSLCSLLKSVGYILKTEIIEEGYRFISGNVVILLRRYFDIQTNLKDTANGPQPDFNSALPSYDSLVPFDSENKWIVTARVDVFNGNDQEHVQKGIDELMSFKDAFEGCFEFPALERRMLDTRVRL